MARVAFVMDDIMGRLGLSGRAFLPMLLGFGCSVPAIMASRALEHRKDRLKTILVTPFMSCSARLPIYVLFSSMFFGKHAMLACYSMYLLGIVIAILTAYILSRIDGSRAEQSLLIELPEYKAPNAADNSDLCMGEGKRLFDKSRNRNLSGLNCYVDSFELWAARICNGYYPELWLYNWKSCCTNICTIRTWLLADCCSTDFRYCGEGSSSF